MVEIACDWRPVTRAARSRRMPRLTSSPSTARQPWAYPVVILPAPFGPVTFANKRMVSVLPDAIRAQFLSLIHI